ncbi:unnamed protein product [Pleuronectes platessa]|uniref:Uncharacterized protein n=1 Tax=Pleuronectes platessa TaxID=8262 RepID=A0A9N7TYQ5_PLEPL|nr:unnamed protein product [Pleuronectes platessa]
MSSKRTYLSGAQKRKKKRTEDEKKEQDKGSPPADLQSPESEEELLPIEEQLPALTVTDTPTSTSAGITGPSTASTAMDVPSTPSTSTSYQGGSTAPPIDPAEWSAFLSDSERTDLPSAGAPGISAYATLRRRFRVRCEPGVTRKLRGRGHKLAKSVS